MVRFSHDPMDNNVEKTSMFCDNCRDFEEIAVCVSVEIWNYYQLMREFINQRKPTTLVKHQEALTKDLEDEEGTIEIYVYLKVRQFQMR